MSVPAIITTTVPLIRNRGTDLGDYLIGHGVTLTQVDTDPTGQFTVVQADRDVTALLAAYVRPAEAPQTRDRINAALQGHNYGEAITRLLAAITLPDD